MHYFLVQILLNIYAVSSLLPKIYPCGPRMIADNLHTVFYVYILYGFLYITFANIRMLLNICIRMLTCKYIGNIIVFTELLGILINSILSCSKLLIYKFYRPFFFIFVCSTDQTCNTCRFHGNLTLLYYSFEHLSTSFLYMANNLDHNRRVITDNNCQLDCY